MEARAGDGVKAGLVIAMIGVLYLSVRPSRLIDIAQPSITTIF